MGSCLRRTARRLFHLLLAAVLLAFAPAYALAQQVASNGPDPALAATHDGGVDATASRTRFVIGLERAVEFQVFSLTEPNRVIVEFPDVKLLLPSLPGGRQVGLIKSVRGGQSAPGRARVVIDVAAPVVVERSAIETNGKHAKLVLEIVPFNGFAKPKTHAHSGLPPPSGLGAAGLQPPLPQPAVRPEVLAAGIYKPVIVIDPGHGGHDSGAEKFGTIEKDVVLAFSLKLRDKLKATGRYHVLMTRDDDTFVELGERRAFAERHKAALFIAVHADYATTTARGATIYSLRESVAKNLQASAKSEVGENVLSKAELAALKSTDDVSTVAGILSDLARREIQVTRDRTSVFARSVIEFMGASTSLHDNPDREAAFAVLKTAQVPSVLIELAYVSNKSDAELLKSDRWREKVSTSIVTAVDNYFSHQVARLPM